MPRSFILLDELDIGLGKGGKQIDNADHAGKALPEVKKSLVLDFHSFQAMFHMGFGMVSCYQSFSLRPLFYRNRFPEEDMSLTRWRAVIIGPQNSRLGDSIYTLEVICSEAYPYDPPKVCFISSSWSEKCLHFRSAQGAVSNKN